MNPLLYCLRCCLLSFLILAPAVVQAKDAAPVETVPEAVFMFANREIVTLRATLSSGTPERRVKRINERMRELSESDLAQPLTQNELLLEGRKGRVFSIGEQPIFVLYEGDLDPEQRLSLEAAAKRVEAAFAQALQARLEQRKGPVLLKGMLLAAAASAIALGLLWLIQRAMQFVLASLHNRAEAARARGNARWRWAEQAWLLVTRFGQLVLLFLWLAVAYLWLTYVLASFPLTEPFANQLSGFLVDLLAMLGHGAVAAIPGLVTVAVVLFLAKAANDVVANIFNGVDQGRLVIPGVHKDTAHATRRLVGILVWGLGIAVAYPYLPLADSDAFKGLSVMFGFMLTLGSAGLVNQLMSGLVLIYSRALRVGDFVSVGELTGVVKEMGMLSTKFINMRNEEITIPNAVLVGNSINNFTSAGGENGALMSTTVTIGYDTPWRQVHAMLIRAAEQTSGLRLEPKPFVLQRGLQDFYVAYELFAYSNRPLERVRILSDLHGHIQDEFNAHGVQIMSPHFALQPRNNVVVPPEQWFAEPAAKP